VEHERAEVGGDEDGVGHAGRPQRQGSRLTGSLGPGSLGPGSLGQEPRGAGALRDGGVYGGRGLPGPGAGRQGEAERNGGGEGEEGMGGALHTSGLGTYGRRNAAGP